MATPTEATRAFGAKIADLRRKRGWSQAQLGEHVGLAVVTISRYECGVSHPTIDTIRRFADALEIEPSELT